MPMETGRDGSWEPLSPSIKPTWSTRYRSMVSKSHNIVVPEDEIPSEDIELL